MTGKTVTQVHRAQIEKMKRKADQQITAHAWLKEHYARWHAVYTVTSLVSSVLLLAVVMATPEFAERTLRISTDLYQWLMAFLAAGTFAIVVTQLALRFDSRSTLHDQAVRHYTKAAYHASKMLKGENEPTEEDVERLRTEYLDDRDLPRIPEKRFLPLKQWHLQKVEISMELDKNPHESVDAIKKRLKVRAAAPDLDGSADSKDTR